MQGVLAQITWYHNLTFLDNRLRIGLILCRERNRVVVEYALRATQHPIGVARYRFTERLPEQLRGSLPTAEELEREIGEAVRADEQLAGGEDMGDWEG